MQTEVILSTDYYTEEPLPPVIYPSSALDAIAVLNLQEALTDAYKDAQDIWGANITSSPRQDDITLNSCHYGPNETQQRIHDWLLKSSFLAQPQPTQMKVEEYDPDIYLKPVPISPKRWKFLMRTISKLPLKLKKSTRFMTRTSTLSTLASFKLLSPARSRTSSMSSTSTAVESESPRQAQKGVSDCSDDLSICKLPELSACSRPKRYSAPPSYFKPHDTAFPRRTRSRESFKSIRRIKSFTSLRSACGSTQCTITELEAPSASAILQDQASNTACSVGRPWPARPALPELEDPALLPWPKQYPSCRRSLSTCRSVKQTSRLTTSTKWHQLLLLAILSQLTFIAVSLGSIFCFILGIKLVTDDD